MAASCPNLPMVFNATAAMLLTAYPSIDDAIAWAGKAVDVPHSRQIACIAPPPFGQQCTLHSLDALRSCLSIDRCRAFTCPSPGPYDHGGRRDGIRGPICQLRSVAHASWDYGERRERRHGMCFSPGLAQRCSNYFLAPLPPTLKLSQRLRSALDALPLRAGSVLLFISAEQTTPPMLSSLGLASQAAVATDARYAVHTVEVGSVAAANDGPPRMRRGKRRD